MKRIWIPQLVVGLMLIWALNPENPYDYYILLRWVCCGIFAYLAFKGYEQGHQGWVWILGITAGIYNPIFRVHLSREIWSVVNIVTIGIAVASVFVLKFNQYETLPHLRNGSNGALEPQKNQLQEKSGIKTTIRVIISVALFAILFIIGGFAINWVFASFFAPLEKYKANFRFLVFFLFWLASLGATFFYESDWKNFSLKHDWFDLVGRIIAGIFWTVAIYLAAFYGIGL